MLIITLPFWVQFICTSHIDTLFIALKKKMKKKKPVDHKEEGQGGIFSLARKELFLRSVEDVFLITLLLFLQ